MTGNFLDVLAAKKYVTTFYISGTLRKKTKELNNRVNSFIEQ